MWAVAMEDVPKIMLHSHASVDNITKHWRRTVSLHPDHRVKCWPCHLLHDAADTCQETQRKSGLDVDPELTGAACISSINVEAIVTAAKAMLGDKTALTKLQRNWAATLRDI
jgi:hypothetical protein